MMSVLSVKHGLLSDKIMVAGAEQVAFTPLRTEYDAR